MFYLFLYYIQWYLRYIFVISILCLCFIYFISMLYLYAYVLSMLYIYVPIFYPCYIYVISKLCLCFTYVTPMNIHVVSILYLYYTSILYLYHIYMIYYITHLYFTYITSILLYDICLDTKHQDVSLGKPAKLEARAWHIRCATVWEAAWDGWFLVICCRLPWKITLFHVVPSGKRLHNYGKIHHF